MAGAVGDPGAVSLPDPDDFDFPCVACGRPRPRPYADDRGPEEPGDHGWIAEVLCGRLGRSGSPSHASERNRGAPPAAGQLNRLPSAKMEGRGGMGEWL